MIRMELLLKEKETKKKRLEKYQQILQEKGMNSMSSTVAVKAFAEGVTQQIKEHLPDEYQNVKCEVTQQQKIMV